MVAVGEIRSVHGIHGGKVAHVLEEDRHFDHVLEKGLITCNLQFLVEIFPGNLERSLGSPYDVVQISHRLLHLSRDTARH